MKGIFKIQKLVMVFLVLQIFILKADAQYKTYKLSIKGDTLNAIDSKGLKQGKWVIHVDPLRGEPGYEAEGIFINDKKEGPWRKYTLGGDIIAIAVSYTHLRAHETDSYLVCRLLLEK